MDGYYIKYRADRGRRLNTNLSIEDDHLQIGAFTKLIFNFYRLNIYDQEDKTPPLRLYVPLLYVLLDGGNPSDFDPPAIEMDNDWHH